MSEPTKPAAAPTSSIADMPHLLVRTGMLDGTYDLDESSVEYMKLARKLHVEMAEKLLKAAPQHIDVGRFTAAFDSLQHSKNLFCDAVIIGNETENRKKRARTE